jgi:NAD-dependent dihydropyrimidine dehydrogenase PreA subunit
MAIEKIDPEICIGCGACALNCPTDVIRMQKRAGKAKKASKAVAAYPEDCQICNICKNLCPVSEAITISPYKGVRPMVGWS